MEKSYFHIYHFLQLKQKLKDDRSDHQCTLIHSYTTYKFKLIKMWHVVWNTIV